ncbi:VanZ family protein [Streptacidiphilus sp. PB12-B1b]|uniref:VanZ family protein n=1 Tax=Streptacidiphilus sp. PB12-B1b TaxID=2705012 RepID=UPI0015FAB69A|nr:VanZ family protein [Streptacidiphilus sp. PB12-B1b]QMU77602.1 VanZ family protein [Streptacidiphilus sp. PB12-B1b]
MAAAPKTAEDPGAGPDGTGAQGPYRTRRQGVGAALVRALAFTFALLCLATCAAVVLELTLAPSPASVGIAHTNLRPGATIRLYLDQPSVREAVEQIGGNILIGVPFGLLLPVLTPRLRGLLRVVAVTSAVILLVELAQHFFVEGRSFDVDDIILAAFGAAVGYLPLGRLLARWAHPRHRHWWQRAGDTLLRRRPAA